MNRPQQLKIVNSVLPILAVLIVLATVLSRVSTPQRALRVETDPLFEAMVRPSGTSEEPQTTEFVEAAATSTNQPATTPRVL
ncbi:MAG: hypothetical protein PWP23_1276 [Candidatus Sumerlaeota bacterium]|nr:hypothetical protein [Candidatus Sumerlaeota bacterium]